jgi:hypothetical protein
VLAAHAEILFDLLGDFGNSRDYISQLRCGLYGGFFDGGEGSHFLGILELLLITLTGVKKRLCKTFVMLPKGVS